MLIAARMHHNHSVTICLAAAAGHLQPPLSRDKQIVGPVSAPEHNRMLSAHIPTSTLVTYK
jgi:hypothetical protein